MNILRRGIPPSKETGKEGASQGSVKRRRIEVTVERETVTMLVRGQLEEVAEMPPTIAKTPSHENDQPEERNKITAATAACGESQRPQPPE
ncbi:MAG: hypothetical protein ACLQGT_12690 [Terracidiphilus sp.]